MNQARSVASLLVGFVVFGVVLWIARTVHQELDDKGFAQTVLIGVGGWALGWLVGFLISPSTSQEIKKFSSGRLLRLARLSLGLRWLSWSLR